MSGEKEPAAQSALDVTTRIEEILEGCHGQAARIASEEGDKAEVARADGLEASLARIESNAINLRSRISGIADRVGQL